MKMTNYVEQSLGQLKVPIYVAHRTERKNSSKVSASNLNAYSSPGMVHDPTFFAAQNSRDSPTARSAWGLSTNENDSTLFKMRILSTSLVPGEIQSSTIPNTTWANGLSRNFA